MWHCWPPSADYGKCVPLTGEELHEKGREGVRLAKRWLEGTMRAEVLWHNPDRCKEKLQFLKASAGEGSHKANDWFSFDCGGNLLGGDTDGKQFLAEVKYYVEGDKHGPQYREFLAKCYQAFRSVPQFCDRFLWISWAPFLIGDWKDLETPEFVGKAILSSDKNQAVALKDGESLDPEVLTAVAERVIVLVVSDRQLEHLTLSQREGMKVRQMLLELRAEDAGD